jgi:hypothetical protein
VWPILLSSQRHLDPQLGATLPLGINPHASPDQAHPLVEANQPQATSAPRLEKIEALSVVGDGQLQAVGSAAQGDACLARARMRDDVAQGLLGNAVQAERNGLRDGLEASGGGERDRDGVLALELGAMRF